jgi:hypothetical protein
MSSVAHVEENMALTEIEPVATESFGKIWS